MSNEIHYIESDYCYDDYDDLGEQNTCEAEESDFEACASEAYAEKSCLLATRAFGVDDDVYFKEDNVARRTLMSAEHVSNASFAQDQFLAITKPPLMKILGNGPAQEVANVLLRGYRNYVSADRDTTNNETMWGSQEPKGFVYEVLDGAKALAREVTQKTGLDDFSFEKAEREVRDSIESVYHEMLREDEEKAELVANEEDVYEEQEWSEDESDYSEDDVCFSSEDYSASCWYEECEQELKTDNAEETSDEQEELETNENQQEFLMPITELVAAVPNEPQPLIIYSTLRQPTGQEGAGTTSTATRQPPSPQDQPVVTVATQPVVVPKAATTDPASEPPVVVCSESAPAEQQEMSDELTTEVVPTSETDSPQLQDSPSANGDVLSTEETCEGVDEEVGSVLVMADPWKTGTVSQGDYGEENDSRLMLERPKQQGDLDRQTTLCGHESAERDGMTWASEQSALRFVGGDKKQDSPWFVVGTREGTQPRGLSVVGYDLSSGTAGLLGAGQMAEQNTSRRRATENNADMAQGQIFIHAGLLMCFTPHNEQTRASVDSTLLEIAQARQYYTVSSNTATTGQGMHQGHDERTKTVVKKRATQTKKQTRDDLSVEGSGSQPDLYISHSVYT